MFVWKFGCVCLSVFQNRQYMRLDTKENSITNITGTYTAMRFGILQDLGHTVVVEWLSSQSRKTSVDISPLYQYILRAPFLMPDRTELCNYYKSAMLTRLFLSVLARRSRLCIILRNAEEVVRH